MLRWISLLVAALALACSSPAPAPRGAAPSATTAPADTVDARADQARRLAWLEREVDKARVEHHVPGLALAVVRGDEVVLVRGFGVKNLDSGAAVTPETLFAIGSSSKAFTAAAIAMLVDEGVMSWDDPATRWLPELTLPAKGGEVTLRDLLSHRTGFPRMSVLWAGGTLTRAEIMRHASRAEPTHKLRELFQYNNVQYLAAGEASARATEATWEELIERRIFGPLGMRASRPTLEGVPADAVATGYTWYPDLKRHRQENVRDLRTIAPAGAIHSNVVDMARWVRLHLGGGVFEGKRLLSEAALAELLKPHIEVAGPDFAYGLGWFVRSHQGTRYIEHGGNIDGFAANVGFFPDKGVGWVLLTNVTATPLQQEIGPLVYEALFGAAGEGASSTEDFRPFLGKYQADFAPFDGKPFEVLLKNGHLAVDVPGQSVFELEPPDDQGRRAFRITNTIAISFEKNAAGKVVAMYVHQGGLDLELPREGVEPPLEVTPADAAAYTGSYRTADGAMTVAVLVHRGRLAVDVPGQMKYQLDPVDADGKRRLRVKRDYYVTFGGADDGQADALTLFQDGKEVVMQRLTSAPKPADLDTVLALRKQEARKRALAKLGHVRMEGEARFPQAGITGKVRISFVGTDRYRQEVDLGKAGRMLTVANGDKVWSAGTFDEPEQLEGLRRAQAAASHPATYVADWRDWYDDVRYTGSESRAGKAVHVVRLGKGELPPVTAYVDAKTGDVIEVRTETVEAVGRMPSVTHYRDFRVVNGLRIPFEVVVEIPQSGQMILALKAVKGKQKADDSLYPPDLPAQP